MLTQKTVPFYKLIGFTISVSVLLIAFGSLVVVLYEVLGLQAVKLPWKPLLMIGTVVSFYLGLKNNVAYDRSWQARKVWGGIVNQSRSWAAEVLHWVHVEEHQRSLIDRHVAWLYLFRKQLLVPQTWEHSYRKHYRLSEYRKRLLGIHEQRFAPPHLESLLKPSDLQEVSKSTRAAATLIDLQIKELSQIAYREKKINKRTHMQMQRTLESLYHLQGQCDCIKDYPLPRQYASVGTYFVTLFVFTLPFGMLDYFDAMGCIWFMPLVYALVGWCFLLTEAVGDYAQNPFEGLANDVPMLSLCKTIEVDLRQMAGVGDIPEKPFPLKGKLM